MGYSLSHSSVGGLSLRNRDTAHMSESWQQSHTAYRVGGTYLEGCPRGVTVVTDHQPLVRLMDQQVLTRVQTRWLRLRLFQLIRPTIKYQPGKANVVADALSRSQRKETENSMDDPMVTAAAIEAHVSTLSGISVELPVEDLQTWTKAYKEDKSYVAAYTKLRQGQKHQDVYMTPWSSGRNGGGSIEDHCSSPFATKYIEGMPQCALHRPRGHAQDLGTCGSAIPLARTMR